MTLKSDLSVIVPTCNRSGLLADCLEALVAQKRGLSRVVVIDDGSEDDTQQVLRRFQDRYPFIVSIFQVNKGIQSALNRGLESVKTELVAIIDDDTVVTENWSEIAQEFFMSHPHVDALSGPIINVNHTLLGHVFDIIGFSKWNAIKNDQVVDDIPTCNAVYRRSSISAIRFREERKNAHYRDSLFNYELRSQGGVIMVTPLLRVYHKTHGDGLTKEDFVHSLKKKAQGFFWEGYLCHGNVGLLVKFFPPLYFGVFFFLLIRSLSSVRSLLRFCCLSPVVFWGQMIFVQELCVCWLMVLRGKRS